MSETKNTSRTNVARGLTDAQAEASRREHGSNALRVRKSKSFIRRFFENLGDPVIRILLVALCVNLIFVFRGGDIAETVGIAVSVFLAAFISALSESGGENAFRRLAGECDTGEYRVRRNGKTVRVGINDIVVGDVVLISAGEKIPADGHIVSGRVSVDQSAITGESKEIEKCPMASCDASPSCKGVLLRGCPVISGEGEMVVFAVGDASFLGKISIEVQADTRESPLKIRLAKLAKQISRLGYLAAVMVALAFLFNCFVIDSGFDTEMILIKLGDVPYLLQKLLSAFMLGLTVIVVAVPDGYQTLDYLHRNYIIPHFSTFVNIFLEKRRILKKLHLYTLFSWRFKCRTSRFLQKGIDKSEYMGYNNSREAPMTVASPKWLKNNRLGFEAEAVIFFYC